MSEEHNTNRVPRGVPTGGEYSEGLHSEPALDDLNEYLSQFDDVDSEVPDVAEDQLFTLSRSAFEFVDRELPGKSADNPDAIDLPGFVSPATKDAFWQARNAVEGGRLTTVEAAPVLRARFSRLSEQELERGLNDYVAHSRAGNEPAADQAIADIAGLDAHRARRTSTYSPAGSVTRSDDGTAYGKKLTGEKYDPSMSTTQAAAHVRNDINEAIATGYLPEGLDYRVHKESASSVRIQVRGLTDEQIYQPDEGLGDQRFPHIRPQRPEVDELKDRISGIADVYRRDQTDASVDYSDTNFYAFIEVEDEETRDFRQRIERQDKAKRERRQERQQAQEEVSHG